MAPNLSQDPNLLTQQLILAAVLSFNGTSNPPFPLPTIQEWAGPSTTTIWVQSLLYASLACSLFAALTAVMGKQWLNHYSSVGERGTIEARGIHRQRKFRGLESWNLRTVLEAVPVLLQLSLVLFGLGLSAYVYDQQRIVATVVIIANGAGVIFYLTIVGLSLWFPDCPFYTPLSSTLRHLYDRIMYHSLTVRGLTRNSTLSRIAFQAFIVSRHVWIILHSFFRCNRVSSDDEEAGSQLSGHPNAEDVHVSLKSKISDADHFAGLAVGWIHETSTDPLVFIDAMRLLLQIKWSSDAIHALPVDVLDRLLDQIHACFQPHTGDRGFSNIVSNKRDLSILSTSAFLFVYWEKLAVNCDQIRAWTTSTSHELSGASPLSKVLDGARHDAELGRLHDLIRFTLRHADYLKRYTSRNTSSMSPVPRLCSVRHQTPTGLDALHIRTTFYLAQHAEFRDFHSAEDRQDRRRHLLYLIQQQVQGVSSPDVLAVAMLACSVAGAYELPFSLTRNILAQERCVRIHACSSQAQLISVYL